MRLPQEISAAAARRRALLFDFVAGLTLAIAAIVVSAGLGIVGVLALITLIVLIVWVAAETGVRALKRRRS